jgi:hypothetical protein
VGVFLQINKASASGSSPEAVHYQVGELILRDRSEGVFTPVGYERHVVSAQAAALAEYVTTGRTGVLG